MYTNTLPITKAVAIVPNDGADLADAPTRAVWVGGAGNVVVDLLNGATVTFSGVPAGTLLWLAAKRVRVASTATLMLACY